MTPERYQKIGEHYRAVQELEPGEREAYLEQACAGDDEMRREVESMLGFQSKAESFIEENALVMEARQLEAEDLSTIKAPAGAGRQIGAYQILAPLGRGGMGEVHLALDPRLGRKVALKLLPAEFTHDRERVRRFEREARAASALNHPNIITIHEIGEVEQTHYIVTEYVEGETLRQRMANAPQKRLKPSEAIELAAQVAAALAAAHEAGITHRDIKPENVMVRPDGLVKVLDFGLAKLTESSTPVLDTQAPTGARADTKTGVVMGTPRYMSPEQARGERVDARTDIFSLGVALYEMLAGRPPFTGETVSHVIVAILEKEPPPLTQLVKDLPAEFERIINHAVAKPVDERYASAKDLLTDLKSLQMRLLVEAELERSSSAAKQTKAEPAESAETAAPHAGEEPLSEPLQRDGATGRPLPLPRSPSQKIVGRVSERNELRAAFNAASAGRGSLLCVAGEPGIGKTTLVEDFLAELAAERQCTIARGRCSERLAGTEAYLPLLEALESLLRGSNPARAQVMKQIAPTWYAQVVPLSGESEESARLLAEVKAASQERVKRELSNFLQAVAEGRPLVLFFDDLHWADVSTIDLLSFLAGKFDALNVLVVVTYRPSDMLLAKHPFLQIKPDLQAHGVCRELQLEFLNEAEIAEYLALEFPDHRFPPEFPKLIHAKTEGSPLFMADLVRYLRDRSVIAQTSGAWALAQTLPSIERELPESVRGMIERKIAQLGEDDLKLLTAASVQGYEFDSAVVGQALNLDANEIEERLEKLERVFAFVKLTSEAEFPNGALTLKYRFVHVLYQNALYASLRATRKATLSRDVARALEGCYGEHSASVANELALLLEAARDYARAADCFSQAARNAAQVNAQREAVQLAERGLEALRKLPETPERDGRELGLQLTLGFSLHSTLSWAAPKARDAFNRARQLCQQLGDDPRLFAALSGVVGYHVIRGELEIAEGLCEQKLQLAEQAQDPVLLVSALHGTWVVVHYYQGDLVAAHQQGERALALDRREYHEAYLSVYVEDLGTALRREHSWCLWMLGYPDRALALAQEAITLAGQMSHPFSLAGAHNTTGHVFFFRRDWPSAQKEFEKVFALAEEYALGDILNLTFTTHALNLAYQEPTEAAIERAKQAIESLRARGVIIWMTAFLASLGEVFWLAGRCVEGLAVIAEALAQVERNGERFYEAEIWRIKGELLLKAAPRNAQAEAESCYHKALEIARQQSAKTWELRAATSLARLWRQQDKTAEGRQMLAEIYGWFTEGFGTADLKEANASLEELSLSPKIQPMEPDKL